jgi:hypothetical protein
MKNYLFLAVLILSYLSANITYSVPISIQLNGGACAGPGLISEECGKPLDNYLDVNNIPHVICEDSEDICATVTVDGNCDWWLTINYDLIMPEPDPIKQKNDVRPVLDQYNKWHLESTPIY